MAVDLNTDVGVAGRNIPLPISNNNFMTGLGGLLFGAGNDGLEGFLTPQQQAAIQQQAMMQAAASLLKSSGRTTQPISLGQALGGAYEAGTAGYQQAQQGAFNQLMTKQKLDEMKREQQLQNMLMSRIPGMTTGATPAPQTATAIQKLTTDG